MRPWLAALALAAACGNKPATAEDSDEPPPAKVTCVAAESGPIDDAIAIRGQVAPPPLAEAVVASPMPGRIAKLNVQEGDVVTANQLVAVMEDPSLGATATESGADVAAAQAALRGATADRTRIEKLVAQGIAPQKELDAARAAEDSARAALAAAEARSGLAHRQLARTDLHAPRAGTVLRVMKRAGETVDGADSAIVEIADLSKLELRAQVTGGELVGLTLHASATVAVDALPGVDIPGEVVAIAPALDPSTSLGTVRILLTPPAGVHLPVGMPAVATVHAPPRTGITVPLVAVRRALDGTDEVVACVDDHAEVRAVDLGRRAGERIEIAKGLAAGDLVVVDRVLGLEDKQEIEQGKDGAEAEGKPEKDDKDDKPDGKDKPDKPDDKDKDDKADK